MDDDVRSLRNRAAVLLVASTALAAALAVTVAGALDHSERLRDLAEPWRAGTALVAWVAAARWVDGARAVSRRVAPEVVLNHGDWAALWSWVLPLWSFFGPVMLVGNLREAARTTPRVLHVVWWGSWVVVQAEVWNGRPDGALHHRDAVLLGWAVGLGLVAWLVIVHRVTEGLAARAAAAAETQRPAADVVTATS